MSDTTPHSPESQLRSLLETARENEAKLRALQDLELRLIDADSLPELISVVLRDLPPAFALDAAVLMLADPGHEMKRCLSDLSHNLSAEWPGFRLLTHDDELLPLKVHPKSPVLGGYDPDSQHWLFGGLGTPPASVAVVTLERHGRVLGALGLASQQVGRFSSGDGTTLIHRLSAVLSVCVENMLNVCHLTRAGITDALTGIKNRRFLDERLTEEVHRARRTKEPVAFMYADIDHFKQINDTYGHDAGDAVLQDVAARMAYQLRGHDVLARYGGEEFAALVSPVDAVLACKVAERVRKAINSRPFQLPDGREIPVTVSIGIATATDEWPDLSAEDYGKKLYHLADRALLKAKQGGRDRVICADFLTEDEHELAAAPPAT
jgi:diguanylate cyclase (GGDEF)-like protein